MELRREPYNRILVNAKIRCLKVNVNILKHNVKRIIETIVYRPIRRPTRLLAECNLCGPNVAVDLCSNRPGPTSLTLQLIDH